MSMIITNYSKIVNLDVYGFIIETAFSLQVLLRPSSKVITRFLTVMMKHGYIGEFEVVDDHRGGKVSNPI
jgi:hypothetical protein